MNRITARSVPILIVWGAVGVCCALPLIWIVGQVIAHPSAWRELRLDPYRIGLLRRTLRGREDLTAVLQVAFPGLGPTTIRVRYGAPLDASTLAAAGRTRTRNDAECRAFATRCS